MKVLRHKLRTKVAAEKAQEAADRAVDTAIQASKIKLLMHGINAGYLRGLNGIFTLS